MMTKVIKVLAKRTIIMQLRVPSCEIKIITKNSSRNIKDVNAFF